MPPSSVAAHLEKRERRTGRGGADDGVARECRRRVREVRAYKGNFQKVYKRQVNMRVMASPVRVVG